MMASRLLRFRRREKKFLFNHNVLETNTALIDKRVIMKLGDTFTTDCRNTGKVTEVFSLGFNYHTLNADGDCIKGQRYLTHNSINREAIL